MSRGISLTRKISGSRVTEEDYRSVIAQQLSRKYSNAFLTLPCIHPKTCDVRHRHGHNRGQKIDEFSELMNQERTR